MASSSGVKHVALVTGNYPSLRQPNSGTFVKNLVTAMAAQGVNVTVVHPKNIGSDLRNEPERVEQNEKIRILRPAYVSFSNKKFGPFNSFALTYRSFRYSVLRSLRSSSDEISAVYGHFMYPAGSAAIYAAQRLNRPGFVAVGEGNFWTLRPLGIRRARKDLGPANGFIAVSNVIKSKLHAKLDLPLDKIAVFPNGVDTTIFFPRGKSAMRKKYGFPQDKFIAIYVGNFIAHKGVQRVAAALEGIPFVAGIYVGSGPLSPRGPNTLFCQRVSHSQVPELLSAADCFVLPSDVEGSSNATLEALACGLPVIVADAPCQDEFAIPTVGRRVPYDDIAAIRNAVLELQQKPELVAEMSKAAVVHAEKFDIGVRACGILDFMSSKAKHGLLSS